MFIDGLKKKIKNILKTSSEETIKLTTLGIPLHEINRLKEYPTQNGDSILYSKKIKIAHAFWHLHSLTEIFIDEVYKFETKVKAPIIIDCGANIGLSIIYFKKLYPEAKIIAFEPDIEICSMLSYNLKTFAMEDVEIVNKAVWNENSELTFFSTGALGGQLNFDGVHIEGKKEISIPAVRLREYLNGKVDFLKIDIEGAEQHVLEDCKDLLNNVQNLFVEYHSSPDKVQELDRLLSIIKMAGFKFYIKEAWNNLPYPFLRNNYQPHFDLQLNIFAYRY